MSSALEAGAFVSVNHPKPFGPPWEYDGVRSFRAVEVWNGPWGRLNSYALSFWESRLRAGQRLVAVGGSDTHVLRSQDPDPRHAQALGMPTTWVEAGPSPDARAIIEALRAGRTFVSASPAGPQLYMDRARNGVEVTVRDAPGAALVILGDHGTIDAEVSRAGSWSTSAGVPDGTTYIRAQLVGPHGDVQALTSPLWWV
jgi:hypothetical protein